MTPSTRKSSQAATQEQVDNYERLMPMLEAAHSEMSELSKKKQDGVLNPLKIRNINRLLDGVSAILKSRPAYEFLEMLDEETIPQNSDAVLLLSQWKAALAQFKVSNHGYDGSRHRWFTVDNPAPTRRP